MNCGGSYEKRQSATVTVSWLGQNLLILSKSQISNLSFPLLGAIRAGLCAKETLRETDPVEPAPSSQQPLVPQGTTSDSSQGGQWDCSSPSSVEAVPESSVKDVMCPGMCEERSNSTRSASPFQGMCPLPQLSSSADRAGTGGGKDGPTGIQPGPAYTQ